MNANTLKEKIANFPASIRESASGYNHEKLLSLLTYNETKAFAEQGEIDLAQSLCKEYEKTIKLSRQLNFNSASAIYQQVDIEAESIGISKIYLYVKQHALSTKAYYYFKQEKYELAKAVTIECISIINHLVKQGCYSLRFRCLGQNENIAKLYFAAGNWQQAGDLFGNILTYLSQGYTDGLIGDFFTERTYSEKYSSLNQTFMNVMFNLGARHLVHFSLERDHDEKVLFELLFRNSLYKESESDKMLRNWLDVKKTFFNSEWSDFLAGSIRFMSEPMSKDFDFLKLSLAYNLVLYINTHVPIENRKGLLSEIRSYITDRLATRDASRDILCNQFLIQ